MKMVTSYRVRIGLREISAMQPHTVLWDLDTRGFCARRQFSTAITYSVYFRTRDGQQRFYKIGRHGPFTPTQARDEANRVLRNVAVGKDPSAELKALRHGPTVDDLCDAYEADMDAGRINGKKASTIRSDKSRITLHIRPKLGKVKVISVTSEMVETLMHGLSPGNGKRIVGLLGAMFSYAIKKKLRADNPCRGIEKPKDVKRMRRLSDAEYGQLWSALNREKNVANDVFLFLTISGWRSSEAKNLTFSEVDLERRIAILSDSKTGQSVRPLSSAAVEIIKCQPVKNGQFVFEHRHGKPINNLTPWWNKLEMPGDVSPHVMRHSFASLGADLGLSDNTIASLLGHSRGTITSRYMHGSDKALIAAADSVAMETMRLMQKEGD
jgi:integrase